MNYPQLIQFKRLEEKAFVFLNGRQLMLGIFGLFGGFGLARQLDLAGWPVYIAVALAALAGLAGGGRYHGLYGYQYLRLLARFLGQARGRRLRPETLYDRPVNPDHAYVLGGPEGQALVMRQAPPARKRQTKPGGPAVYRLRPADLAQHPPQSLAGLMQRWAGFWAGLRPPLRLIVHSTPFHASGVVDAARQASLRTDKAWLSQALVSYSRFLERLTRQAAMYQVAHELVLWAGSQTEAGATVSSLASWLSVPARPAELTPLLTGDYEVGLDHLRPLDSRQPYLVLMVSHEFNGEWSWADPLVSLLRQTFPLSLALDVERNLPPHRALSELVKYENVLMDVLYNNQTGRDPKAEAALRDVQLAMHKANAGWSLHFATVVVAVRGTTLAEARTHAETVRTLTAARLALITLPGGQGELVKFFTETKRKEIAVPEISHNITSDGMAVVGGALGFRRRSQTDGIFWGIGSSGGQDTYPIFWNGFGRDPDKPAAYHGLILGKTGYGKTVALGALLYREALRGTQVIALEPQGHSKRLADLGGAGASYNPLSLRTMQLNPLDPISDNLSEQKAYEMNLIRLMLSQIDPGRRLNMEEAGLLDAALSAVYEDLDDPLQTPPLHVPRLEQLCHELEREPGSRRLAADLALNFVSGSLGAVYNQPTNLDVALEADLVTYDFKEVPLESRALIYTLVLGRIQRTVRAHGRVRRRVVAIDEYGWLAQEPLLSETVAMWIKTFRTFGCGVWVAEQDLIRLTGGAAAGDLSGHSIIGNSVFQLFFNHEPSAAAVVSETFPNVDPYREMMESFPRPQETGLAEAVLRLPDGVYHSYMLLSEMERRVLIGS